MWRLVLINVLVLLCACISGQARTALVIGNKDYENYNKNRLFKPLHNPENDARDIGEKLRELGFDVELKMNCSKVEIESSMVKFRRQLESKGGIGFFFYAGHGIQVEGVNYVIPVKNDIRDRRDVQDMAVKVDQILRGMEKAEMKIIVLDACRNNPFVSETGDDSHRGGGSKDNGFADMKAPRGSLIAFATEPGKTAKDNKRERNGTFTKHLLRHIKAPNTDIAVMLRRVRKAVSRETKGEQVPTHRESLLAETFYFNKKSVMEEDKYEPNNTRMESREILSGELSGILRKGDEDWYKFSTAGSDKVELKLSFIHAKGDLELELYDKGGKKLGSSTEEKDEEEISKKIATSTVYVRVYGYKGAGNKYALSMRKTKSNTAEEWFKKGMKAESIYLKIGYYSRALEISPNYVKAYIKRGEVYEKLKRRKEALKDYNKALELSPGNAEVYYLRGVLYRKLEKKSESISDFKKYLKLVGSGGKSEQVREWLKQLVDTPRSVQIRTTSEDGRFQVFSDNVIKDTHTGLEWYVGPDKGTTHYEAEKWVNGLSAGGGGWRMPKIEELRGIYENGKGKYNLDPVFGKFSVYKNYLWVWSGELLDSNGKPSQNRNSPRARYFRFHYGDDSYGTRGLSGNFRVFAVRR